MISQIVITVLLLISKHLPVLTQHSHNVTTLLQHHDIVITSWQHCINVLYPLNKSTRKCHTIHVVRNINHDGQAAVADLQHTVMLSWWEGLVKVLYIHVYYGMDLPSDDHVTYWPVDSHRSLTTDKFTHHNYYRYCMYVTYLFSPPKTQDIYLTTVYSVKLKYHVSSNPHGLIGWP